MGPRNRKGLLRQRRGSPECIAGGVKTDDPLISIGVGHDRVGLTADQARLARGWSNDDPRHSDGLTRGSLVCQRVNRGKVSRNYELVNPGAQRVVVHTS
jgi:hypothetical protein